MTDAAYVRVAVATPVRKVFTYQVPPALAGQLSAGHLVEVPFGRTRLRGLVLGSASAAEAQAYTVKELSRLVEPEPLLSLALVRTLSWAADYYLTAPGEMAFAALPPSFRKSGKPSQARQKTIVRPGPELDPDVLEKLRRRAPLQAKIAEDLLAHGERELSQLRDLGASVNSALRALAKKGWVLTEKQSHYRAPQEVNLPAPAKITKLTDEQDAALQSLLAATEASQYAPFLLHGVTGSGKTEVYLRAIAHCLAQGRGAILLVPEISLTPQLSFRLRARFGSQVAVLHSGLGEGVRKDEWWRLQKGQARVAVGARSAVFAPVADVGIVVVDEEHDSSYKQSERLPYNGRDLAMVRAREEGAVVVLGTATPSVESYLHAQDGRSTLLQLQSRVDNRSLPEIEVDDLKRDMIDPIERIHTVGPRLAQALAETLDRGQQAILFLNRRGYSSSALCSACGQSVRCINCSVALVYHRAERFLRCHYCGYSIAIPDRCAHCDSGKIQLLGLGTEKCEAEVRRRFPGARIIRLDSDTTARRGAVHEKISQFARGEADVLIGTQMVTKGHDVAGVTLVGVLLADLSLSLPDFRAEERTFQLLVQVAGRAGRGEQPGRVIVQTFMPHHESIRLAAKHSYEEFFQRELRRRQGLGYPPHRRLMMIRVSHIQEQTAEQFCGQVARLIRQEAKGNCQVLGPVTSPLAKLRGRHRFQMLLKAASVRFLHQMASVVQAQCKPPAGTKILFDVDPLDML